MFDKSIKVRYFNWQFSSKHLTIMHAKQLQEDITNGKRRKRRLQLQFYYYYY